MNRIYYYKTLRMILILFIAAPAMIAASIYVIFIPIGIIAKVIGYIGAVFFSLCFIIGLRNFLRGEFGREALTLTPASLTINAMSKGNFTVKWSDIADTLTTKIGNERMLVIQLYDPQAFIDQHGGSAIARRIMEADMKCVGSPCSVVLSNIDTREDDIELIIKQYIRKYGRSAATDNGPAQN